MSMKQRLSQIIGGGNPYECRQIDDLGQYITSEPFPAWEVNGKADISPGASVQAHKSPSGRWVFDRAER